MFTLKNSTNTPLYVKAHDSNNRININDCLSIFNEGPINKTIRFGKYSDVGRHFLEIEFENEHYRDDSFNILVRKLQPVIFNKDGTIDYNNNPDNEIPHFIYISEYKIIINIYKLNQINYYHHEHCHPVIDICNRQWEWEFDYQSKGVAEWEKYAKQFETILNINTIEI